jgi:uncharacterized membrane protein
MNIVLWILQGLLAAVFLMVGRIHAFQFEKAKENPRIAWVKDIPRGLLTFIGICEILGAVGLILPALTGILPWLTPLAALLLAVMMFLATGFHMRRHEQWIGNLILLALLVFVAYGRWVLVPL